MTQNTKYPYPSVSIMTYSVTMTLFQNDEIEVKIFIFRMYMQLFLYKSASLYRFYAKFVWSRRPTHTVTQAYTYGSFGLHIRFRRLTLIGTFANAPINIFSSLYFCWNICPYLCIAVSVSDLWIFTSLFPFIPTVVRK